MTREGRDEVVNEILGWWHALYPRKIDGREIPGDSGARARLRRTQSINEAMLEPQFHVLYNIVRIDEKYLAKLAVLATTLPRLSSPDASGKPRFATLLGQTPGGDIPGEHDRARLSPLRFGNLLRAGNDPSRFAVALRRAIAILDGAPFNMRAFIRDVLWFTDETRRDWTFQYYQTWQARRGTSPNAGAPDANTHSLQGN